MEENRNLEGTDENIMAARKENRGHPGRGDKGACGGERRENGSGPNRNTTRQPGPKRKKK